MTTAAALAVGQDPSPPPPPPPPPANGTADLGRDVHVHATAEDVLRALQRSRPRNEPIPPASSRNRPSPKVKHLLWPEGARLVSREGTLQYDGEWWAFDPCEGEAQPRFKLERG